MMECVLMSLTLYIIYPRDVHMPQVYSVIPGVAFNET